MLSFDIGGVASAGKPLPEGEYEFLIEQASVKPAASGSSHNMVLKLSVQSENENGRVHTENMNLQEKTMPFAKAFFCALWGLEDEELTNLDFDVDETDGTLNAVNGESIVGSSIGGYVKHVADSKDPDTVYGNVMKWFNV